MDFINEIRSFGLFFYLITRSKLNEHENTNISFSMDHLRITVSYKTYNIEIQR